MVRLMMFKADHEIFGPGELELRDKLNQRGAMFVLGTPAWRGRWCRVWPAKAGLSVTAGYARLQPWGSPRVVHAGSRSSTMRK